jgi:chemotaxis protein MotB
MGGRSVKANIRSFLLILVGSSALACVTSGTYDAKVAELNQSLDREKALTGQRDDLQKRIDAANATIADLKGRLQKLGQDVEGLSGERTQLQGSLANTQAQLAELQKQKAAAEARAATFRTLVEKLRSMVDSGKIKVTIRNGRMLLALPNDVLFDSGKTALKPEGKDAIGKVAQVLATIEDRHFLVGGHTDNVPIKNAKFPSNWELSTARAVEVTKLLISGGMKPQVLGAAGYADADPVASNDTPEGKAQNRRIEIVLEPNLSDLPNLDSLIAGEKK